MRRERGGVRGGVARRGGERCGAEHGQAVPRVALTALICLALWGCGGPGPSSDDDLGAASRLAAVEEMRIGDVDDPDLGFSQITGVDVDDDGNVYVLEARVPEIRVFGADGALLRRIGRQGEGPGEFQGAPRFGVVGDTVWAYDTRAARITLFDRRGTLLSTASAGLVSVTLPIGYGYVSPLMMRPDGMFTSHLTTVAYDEEAAGQVRPTDPIPVPFVLFDADGAVTDTIGWAGRPPPRIWRPPGDDDTEFNTIQVDGRRLVVPSPPTTLPWWLPLKDGYVLVETPRAEAPDEGVLMVTRLGLLGDTVYHRAFRYEPKPFSSADLDSIAARAARGEPGGMLPYAPMGAASTPDNWRQIARSLRAAMDFPALRLPISYPTMTQDESVWLKLAEEDGPHDRWMTLDAEGRPRGQLELPTGSRIMWSQANTFWTVEPDELDVPWVVRYRIEEPAG